MLFEKWKWEWKFNYNGIGCVVSSSDILWMRKNLFFFFRLFHFQIVLVWLRFRVNRAVAFCMSVHARTHTQIWWRQQVHKRIAMSFSPLRISWFATNKQKKTIIFISKWNKKIWRTIFDLISCAICVCEPRPRYEFMNCTFPTLTRS